MPDSVKITKLQRKQLNLVANITVCNPFSDKAAEYSQEFIEISDFSTRPDDLKTAIKDIIINSFKKFDKQLGHPVCLDDFSDSIRQDIYYAICYWFYHEYLDQMDSLAIKQLNKPNKSLPVDFADELIAKLLERGFSIDDCCRILGLFYQLRRGWLFISSRLIGEGPSMKRMREDLWNNIFTHNTEIYEKSLWFQMEDFSTLLLGPTGSGKGAAASAIGYSSYIPYNKAKKQFDVCFMDNFVPVNLSQFPETLLESELFGHSRGAFTGAVDAYDGLFARCGQYGTVFMDEIAEIKNHTQVKLLKVLEERTFSPLGSHEIKKFCGRVIAATHQPIEQLCENGTFRNDLYYRLCSDVIYVPSLRCRLDESPGELELMVNHLLGKMVGGESKSVADMVLMHLTREIPTGYPWPGNVRELAQLIRRIIIKEKCNISSASLAVNEFASSPAMNECSISELTEHYCRSLYSKYKNYQEVARITGLNWRTVKKMITNE